MTDELILFEFQLIVFTVMQVLGFYVYFYIAPDYCVQFVHLFCDLKVNVYLFSFIADIELR